MKKLVLLLIMLTFVSADVTITDSSIATTYSPFDYISGEIGTFSIYEENYNEVIVLSNGSEIPVGSFLSDNNLLLENSCIPSDCEMTYSSSGASASKITAVDSSQDKYVGFVLTGDDLVINTLDFKASSDFGKGSELPLSIQFFEGEQWYFEEFSEDFLPKDWGCYDSSSKFVGPFVGTSFYCEMITMGDSGKIKIGADVTGGSGDVKMEVSPAYGLGGSSSCTFNPALEDGCEVNPSYGDIFSAGDYRVCVGADSATDWNIYKETSGNNCGFAMSSGSVVSSGDYAIFAQGVKYAAAGTSLNLGLDAGHVASANSYIQSRYGGDCTSGCILPLKVSGVSQNFRVYDLDISYNKAGETYSSSSVYSLSETPAKLYFVNSLDLGLLNIVVSKAGEYFATFLGEDLFRDTVSFYVVPVVSDIIPKNPSVGVDTNFSAIVTYESGGDLSYEWDFGDNTTTQTLSPEASHTYTDLGNYTLSLKVIPDGNSTLSSVTNFTITVTNSGSSSGSTLEDKKIFLSSVKSKIKGYSVWYESAILGALNVSFFESELDRLESMKNEANGSSALIDAEISDLDIPIDVKKESSSVGFFTSTLGDVDVAPVVSASGVEAAGTNTDYAASILGWQNANIEVSVNTDKISASSASISNSGVLTAYSFNVKSNANEESYFVIGVPFNALTFKSNVGAESFGDYTVVTLSPGSQKSIEFYYESLDSAGVFVSPALSSIPIDGNIDYTCNYNGICEEDFGEDKETCSNDCGKDANLFWPIFISAILLLLIYTGLQLWYKRHYENYLFKNRSEMYNLVMYATNARARGITDSKIVSDLKSKGWSAERVKYVIRKSAGKNTGMIEIIPIEFVSAMLRKRKAKKSIGATTQPPQQNNNNINKSRVPR